MIKLNFGKSNADSRLENGKAGISKKMISVMIAVVIVLAAVVGISIYNTPENRISRQLNLGHSYLKEGQYEEAALAFEKVIAIDEKNMEAYVGGLEAYIHIGDEVELQTFYDKAITVVENSGQDFLKQNMDYVVEIYVSAEQVYSSSPQQAVEVLEKGWDITARTEVKEKLVESYYAIVEKGNGIENYEEDLKVYDRLLELNGEDERVLESLRECLTAYMKFLMEERRYDEIKALAHKYGDIVPRIDFEEFTEWVEEPEAVLAEEEAEQDAAEENADDNRRDSRYGNGDSGGSWVDDLYRKMIAEEPEEVFAILAEPDLKERCEKYTLYDDDWEYSEYLCQTENGQSISIFIHKDFPRYRYANIYVSGHEEEVDHGYWIDTSGQIEWIEGNHVHFYDDRTETWEVYESNMWPTAVIMY